MMTHEVSAPRADGVATLVASVLMGLMTLAVALQVISRYLVHFHSGWTEELARILLLWVTCAGATYGVRRSAHFHMNLFEGRGPPRLQQWVQAARLIITVLVLLLLAYSGVLWCFDEALESSATLPITEALPMAAIPVAALGMAWSVIASPRALHRHVKPDHGHS